MHTVKSLQAILRDHINYPNSICNHAEHDLDPLDREKTINAIVMDLNARALHIAWGNPCTHAYHTYHLDT
jgi:isopenicillin-N N-acyltransferase-like protein